MAVISSCIKGDLACASRGRPSPRRLPETMRARILHLARTRYAGFNDHHLCEKLREVEGLSLGRETLRRLLRAAGLGSPRKRRPPTHRRRRLARAIVFARARANTLELDQIVRVINLPSAPPAKHHGPMLCGGPGHVRIPLHGLYHFAETTSHDGA